MHGKLLKDKEKIKKIGLKQLLEQGQQVINQIAKKISARCASEIDSSWFCNGLPHGFRSWKRSAKKSGKRLTRKTCLAETAKYQDYSRFSEGTG
jgi:hypothetical protein